MDPQLRLKMFLNTAEVWAGTSLDILSQFCADARPYAIVLAGLTLSLAIIRFQRD